MRPLLFIIAVLVGFNCQAQKRRFDTTLNVVSNGANWTLKATADSTLFMCAAWDSAGHGKFSILVPNVPVAGRTGRKIFADSLKAIKLRYNLTLK